MADPAPPPSHPRARRLGAVLATALVALVGVAALILFFQSRDDSQLDRPATAAGPGRPLADEGRALVGEGVVRADGVRMDAAAVAGALRLGNVVLLHGSAQPPAALRALAEQIAGPFEPALLRSGQAVVIARRAGVEGVVALAARRTLSAADPADPALEAFVSHWLGRR